MPLAGSLQDLSLPNLIQLQCSEPRRVQVRLDRRGEQARLVMAEGEIVFASVGALSGDAAVYELLTWEEAEFQVTDGPATLPPRNVEAPWSALILEGLRRADEGRAARDAALEAALQAVKGKQGVRAAWVVDASGQVRAAASNESTEQDAALTAFMAERAQALARLLEISEKMDTGAFDRFLAITPTEKLWVEKCQALWAGGWIEPRSAITSLTAAIASATMEH